MKSVIFWSVLLFGASSLNAVNLQKKVLPINYESQFSTSRISVKGNQDDTLYYDNGDLGGYYDTTGWYGVIFYHAYPCTVKGVYVSFLGASTDSSTLYAIDFKQDNPESISVKDMVKFISNGYPGWTYVPLNSPWVDSNHFTLLVSIPPTLPVIDNQPNHTDPIWGVGSSVWYDPTTGTSAALDGNLLLRASVNFVNAHDIAANSFMDRNREGIFVYAGDTINSKGTILNRGENDETNVPVALTIYNGADTVYSDTVTEPSILVDTEDTLSFADFSDTVLGNYTASLRYLGSDYVPHNDEISVDLGIVEYPGQLYYDDGSVDDIHIRDAGNAWAVKFVPPHYPVVLDTVKIYLSNYGGTGDRNDACFGVYDDDGINGLPGTPLLFDSLINKISTNQWNVIGIKKEGIRIDSGAFYVVYQQYGNYPDAPAMAFNETPPISRNTYYFDGTNWGLWDKTEEEAMLRVSVSNILDNDVGIYSVESPTKYSPADSVIPIITVKNYGTNTASFDAICTIDTSGTIVYADTVSISGLSYNEMKQIGFSPWLPSAVSGQVYNVSFNLDMTGDEDLSNNASTFTTTVISNMDYLVWDPDPDHSSGPVVDSILKSKGYNGIYLTDITEVESVINEFASIFIFLGQYPNKYLVNASGNEAAILSSYIPGGNTYLEGGDVWYYDPAHGGFNFNPYFGITAVSDGNSGGISQAVGDSGTLTEGMTFTYSGETKWTDFVKTDTTITPNAVMAFTDGAGDTIGFYRDAGTYKTWGFTAEFSGLDDSSTPSTKSALLDTIMHSFGLSFAQPNNIVTEKKTSKIIPNPFLSNTTIRFSIIKRGNVSIRIYDTAGRCVNTLINKPFKEGNYTIKWDGRDYENRKLPAGVYFTLIKTGNSVKSLKLIKLR